MNRTNHGMVKLNGLFIQTFVKEKCLCFLLEFIGSLSCKGCQYHLFRFYLTLFNQLCKCLCQPVGFTTTSTCVDICYVLHIALVVKELILREEISLLSSFFILLQWEESLRFCVFYILQILVESISFNDSTFYLLHAIFCRFYQLMNYIISVISIELDAMSALESFLTVKACVGHQEVCYSLNQIPFFTSKHPTIEFQLHTSVFYQFVLIALCPCCPLEIEYNRMTIFVFECHINKSKHVTLFYVSFFVKSLWQTKVHLAFYIMLTSSYLQFIAF